MRICMWLGGIVLTWNLLKRCRLCSLALFLSKAHKHTLHHTEITYLEMTQCDLFVNSAQSYTNQPVNTNHIHPMLQQQKWTLQWITKQSSTREEASFQCPFKEFIQSKGESGERSRTDSKSSARVLMPVSVVVTLWGQKRRQRGQAPIGASKVKRKRNKWTQLRFCKTQKNPEIEGI